jgi:signal transduction histidine kinase
LAIESDELTLTVIDDGIGISPERALGSKSVGLVGMRERALRWGGNVSVAGESGGGTRVVVRMPLHYEQMESSR